MIISGFKPMSNQFSNSLQSQFKIGMNWKNHGLKGWHIDHKIPLASANSQQEMEKLCHCSNLQPLWWYENLSKKDKIL